MPDAAHVHGGYPEVGRYFLQRHHLQDLRASFQEQEVALFGGVPEKVEVARVGLEEQLFGGGARPPLALLVLVELLRQECGRADVDVARGYGLHVHFGLHVVQAGGIVGQKLAGEGESHVIRLAFRAVGACVPDHARHDVPEEGAYLSLPQKELVSLVTTQFAMPQAQFLEEVRVYAAHVWVEVFHSTVYNLHPSALMELS